MLDGITMRTLHSALKLYSARSDAVTDNIANVNTPYYTAKQVSFEADLKRALAEGRDPMAVDATTTFSRAGRNLTGNNVSLDEEIVAGMRNGLASELVLRATGDRFSVLRSATRMV
jgi:flagellar basal-body rod protein FlgB